MAVSDLLSTLFIGPSQVLGIYFGRRWLIGGKFGEAVCKLSLFFQDTSISVSFYSCLFIAFDRYLAIAHPMKGGFRKSQLKYIISGIWIFSGLILSPYFFSVRLMTVQDLTFCSYYDNFFWEVHYYVQVILVFGVPVPIIITLYGMIVYKLRRNKMPGNQTDETRRKRLKQNSNVLMMSIAIASILTLSWGFLILIVLLRIKANIKELNVNWEHWHYSVLLVAHLSFDYNFFICLIFSNIYRQNFKALMKYCCKCKLRSSRDIAIAMQPEMITSPSTVHTSYCRKISL